MASLTEQCSQEVKRQCLPYEIEIDLAFFSDPEADCDDQLALLKAIKHAQAQGQTFAIFILFKGNKMKLIEFAQACGLVLDGISIYGQGEIPANVVYKPKRALVIAPGVDSILDHLDLSNLTDVAFQGNLPCIQEGMQYKYKLVGGDDNFDNSVAFNDNQNLEFFKKLTANVTVWVATTKACQKHVFSAQWFHERNVPKQVQDVITQSVFKLLSGRMHPMHPAAPAVAELLINPDMDPEKGKNYWLAKQIFDAKSESHILPEPTDNLIAAVANYVTAVKRNYELNSQKLLAKALEANEKYLHSKLDCDLIAAEKAKAKAELAALKDVHPTTERRLLELCLMLKTIFKDEPCYEEDGHWYLFTSSNGPEQDFAEIKLHDIFPSQYNEFVEVGIFTPYFDLYTWESVAEEWLSDDPPPLFLPALSGHAEEGM